MSPRPRVVTRAASTPAATSAFAATAARAAESACAFAPNDGSTCPSTVSRACAGAVAKAAAMLASAPESFFVGFASASPNRPAVATFHCCGGAAGGAAP